jgi:hypothetical protein
MVNGADDVYVERTGRVTFLVRRPNPTALTPKKPR